MTHRQVGDVMTAQVITATEDTPFKELVSLMTEHRISALPVLGYHGRVTGVVSETDLLRKEEYAEDPEAKRPPWWRHRRARARAAGLTAADVMTSPAATIVPEASIVTAAREMDRRHVRRLVVTGADGWLRGIVTPSDLLRVYLRSDEEIRAEILQEIITHYLGADRDRVKIAVNDGVVTLAGRVENKSMIALAVRMSRAVDGVVDVIDQLGYDVDDTYVPSAVPPATGAAGG